MEKLNQSQFNEVKNDKGIKVVDFYADWCGPCKMLSSVLDDLSKEMGDSVEFIKIDIDESLPLAKEYNVTSVPTLIFLKDGKEVDRTVGFVLKDVLKQKISNI